MTPVGVERLDPQDVHRQLTGTVLSTGALSQFTENVLRQYALDTVADADAAAALAEMHTAALADPQPDALFALAELSFRHAGRGAAAGKTFPWGQVTRSATRLPNCAAHEKFLQSFFVFYR